VEYILYEQETLNPVKDIAYQLVDQQAEIGRLLHFCDRAAQSAIASKLSIAQYFAIRNFGESRIGHREWEEFLP
jgi:hypothetical protein